MSLLFRRRNLFAIIFKWLHLSQAVLMVVLGLILI